MAKVQRLGLTSSLLGHSCRLPGHGDFQDERLLGEGAQRSQLRAENRWSRVRGPGETSHPTELRNHGDCAWGCSLCATGDYKDLRADVGVSHYFLSLRDYCRCLEDHKEEDMSRFLFHIAGSLNLLTFSESHFQRCNQIFCFWKHFNYALSFSKWEKCA